MKITTIPFIILCLNLSLWSCKNVGSPNNQAIIKMEDTTKQGEIDVPKTAAAYGFKRLYEYSFTGKKNDDAIHLSVYVFENGQIKGHYHYENDLIQIPIIGQSDGHGVSFTTFSKSKEAEIFKGRLDKNDSLKGTWIDGTSQKAHTFSLRIISAGSRQDYGDFMYRRYIYGSADSIETFMKQVKTAIANDNATWLSERINYPFGVTINNNRTTILNKEEFIGQYTQIGSPKFKERVAAACPLDLFTRRDGIMLGNGEIWIEKTNPAEGRYDYVIIAINN